MFNTVEKNAYYYLRSLPFFAGVVLFFICLRNYPETVRNLNSYIVRSNPEEEFGTYGWSLYYIILPFCVAGLSRVKIHWLPIAGLLLYPVALSFSYWLWELLGWVVMGVYLMTIVGMVFADNRIGKKHNIYEGFVIAVCALYAVVRVIGSIFYPSWLGWGDVGFVLLFGAYFVITALIDVFQLSYDRDGDDATVHPAGISLLYTMLMTLSLLFAGGSESLATFSFSAADRKQYNTLISSAEEAQNTENYRQAAKCYTEASALRFKQRNAILARSMNYKADSLESKLRTKIQYDLNALKKEKRNSRTFETHANEIEHEITLLENNASRSTSSSTIKKYKEHLATQRKRKR